MLKVILYSLASHEGFCLTFLAMNEIIGCAATGVSPTHGSLAEADECIKCKTSKAHFHCKSCSACMAPDSSSCSELSVPVCHRCGALQKKEETLFESPATSYANFGVVNDSPGSKVFIAKTYAVANTLNLPPKLTDEVIQLAEKVANDGILKRQKTGPKIAACIHYVTRNFDFYIPLKKLSVATQTPMSHINGCLRRFTKILKLEPLPFLNYISHLEKYLDYVKVDSSQTIVEWSIDIESIVKTVENGISPSIAAAALLKVVLDGKRIPFRFKPFCENIPINYTRANNTANKIQKQLFSFSQRIPWKPTTLSAKNVSSFLPEIIKYHKQFKHEGANNNKLATTGASFREKVDIVFKLKDGVTDGSNFNDPAVVMIWELLEKGCSREEIVTENLATLSKRYLDFTNENYEDIEIDDGEIDDLLKSNDSSF